MDCQTFRLDDISPAMDWKKFTALKSIFDKYGIKPLIGVVPDNKDSKLNIGKENPDFWEFIERLQNEGWVVAQHGYSHLYVNENPGILRTNKKSEFAGLPFKTQYKKIKKGKKILLKHSIKADIFMAPSHSYDKNTLRALKKLNFKYVTDGLTKQPYRYMGLKFIPCKHWLPVEADGTVTFCLHTNTLRYNDFNDIEKYILKNRSKISSYSEVLKIQKTNRLWFIEEKLNIALRIIKNIFL